MADLESKAWDTHHKAWNYDYASYLTNYFGDNGEFGYASVRQVEMQKEGVLAVVDIHLYDQPDMQEVVLFDFNGNPITHFTLNSSSSFVVAPDADTGHFYYSVLDTDLFEVTIGTNTVTSNLLNNMLVDAAFSSIDVSTDFGYSNDFFDLNVVAATETPDGGYLLGIELIQTGSGEPWPQALGVKVDASGTLVSKTPIEGLIYNGFKGLDGNLYLETEQVVVDEFGQEQFVRSYKSVDLSTVEPTISEIFGDQFYDARWELYGFETKVMLNGETVDLANFAPNGIPLGDTQELEVEDAYVQADGSTIVNLFIFDENDPLTNSHEHLVRFDSNGQVVEEYSLPSGYWQIDADEPGNNLYLQSPPSNTGEIQLLKLNLAGDTLPTIENAVDELGFDLNMDELYPNLPDGYVGFIEYGTGNDHKVLLEVAAYNPLTDEDASTAYLTVLDEDTGTVLLNLPVQDHDGVSNVTLTEDDWIYFRTWVDGAESFYRLDLNDQPAGLQPVEYSMFWNAVNSENHTPNYHINGHQFDFEGFSTDTFIQTAADEPEGSRLHVNHHHDTGFVDNSLVVLDFWNSDLDVQKTLILLYGPDATSPDEYLHEAILPLDAQLVGITPDSFLYTTEVEGQSGQQVLINSASYNTADGINLAADMLFGGNPVSLEDVFPGAADADYEVFVTSTLATSDVTMLVAGAFDPATEDDLLTSYIAIVDNQTGTVLDTQEFNNVAPWNLWLSTHNDDVYIQEHLGWDDILQIPTYDYFKADLTSTPDTINLTQITADEYNAVFGYPGGGPTDPRWEAWVNDMPFNFEGFSTPEFQITLDDEIEGIRVDLWYVDGMLDSTLVRVDLFHSDTNTDQSVLLLYGPNAASPEEFSHIQVIPEGHFVIDAWAGQFKYFEPVVDGEPGDVYVKEGNYDSQNGFNLDASTLFAGNVVNTFELFPGLQPGFVAEVEHIAVTQTITAMSVGAWNPSTGEDVEHSSSIAILDSTTGNVIENLPFSADAHELYLQINENGVVVSHQWWDHNINELVENYYQLESDGQGQYELVSIGGGTDPVDPPEAASYRLEAEELAGGGTVVARLFLESTTDINAVDLELLYDEQNFNLVGSQLQDGWSGSDADRHDGTNPSNGSDIAISAINTVAASVLEPFVVLVFEQVNPDSQFDISVQSAQVSSTQMALDGLPALDAMGDSVPVVIDLDGVEPPPANLIDLRNAQISGNELTVEVWFDPQSGESVGSLEWTLDVLDASGGLVTETASAATPNFDVFAQGLNPTNNLDTGAFSFSGAGTLDTEILLTTVSYQLDSSVLGDLQVSMGDAAVGIVQADNTLDVTPVSDELLQVESGFTLEGVVSFWADQSISVSGADIVLQQGNDIVGTSSTDPSGAFAFDQLDEGDYQVDVTLSDPAADEYQSVVSAAEASTAARLAVGLIDNSNISEYAKLAADIDQNGQISAADASMIARQAVGLVQLDGWTVVEELTTAELDALAQDSEHDSMDVASFENQLQLTADSSQNYVAVLLGDIDGSAVSLLDELNAPV